MDLYLTRLRDSNGEALRSLARLIVEQTTRTPVREIAPPSWLASQLTTVLEAITRGDLLRSFVEKRVESGRGKLADDDRLLRTLWPEEVDAPLREVLSQEWSPSEAIMFRVLDQPAMRSLVADILTTSLTRFREKMSSHSSFLRGIGSKASRRGKGIFGGFGGNLGGLAGNVVGAVREEFESGLDELMREFVVGATRDALQGIARYVSSDDHRGAFAELRVGVLDVLLDTPISDLAAEVDKARPIELVDVLIMGIRATISAPDFRERAEETIGTVLDEMGDGTLAAWLDEVDLREVWTNTTTELITQRLQAAVRTEEFEAWWDDLHREGI